ncbi:MAG: ROK family transcriptional regulator [Mycetocola sp.]
MHSTPHRSTPVTERAVSGNLSLLLGILHRDGSATRAELTRRTGLNRSTIAALVAELVSRGLVIESDPPAAAGAGRPSPLVEVSRSVVAIAMIAEVDAVTIAIVGFDGRVVTRLRFEMEEPPSVRESVQIAGTLIGRMDEALRGLTVAGIGVAVPGLVRSNDGFVRDAPHLGWTDEPLGALLAEATGLPVWAGNDANLGARAEQLFGSATGSSYVLYMNGGPSGIGGGIIVGGELLGGAEGYAGEFGHNRVAPPPGSGSEAGLELEQAVNQRRLLSALGRRGAGPDEVDRLIRESDDATFTVEAERQRAILSVGVGNMVNILNPERVVLGGFLSSLLGRDHAGFLTLLEDTTLAPSRGSVEVVGAQLGSDLLLIGAAELVFDGVIAAASARL